MESEITTFAVVLKRKIKIFLTVWVNKIIFETTFTFAFQVVLLVTQMLFSQSRKSVYI